MRTASFSPGWKDQQTRKSSVSDICKVVAGTYFLLGGIGMVRCLQIPVIILSLLKLLLRPNWRVNHYCP